MRVGGPADLFAVAHNVFELRGARRVRPLARASRHVVLGRGSDVVIADAGVRGLVVQVRAEGTARRRRPRYVAEAGVPMARAATETQKAGLTGLEFGLAIPGTVGGAVWANAGAHESGRAGRPRVGARCCLADGTEARSCPRPSSALGYRDSRFKAAARGRRRPARGRRRRHVPPRRRPTPDEIKARLDEIRRWRQAHQPLGIPSAGCVFRNPAGDVGRPA